jgi:hypothetical protein
MHRADLAMRTALTAAILIASTMGTTRAFADEDADCLQAAEKGQNLRDEHKLIEAREQFRRCAVASCPVAVQTDCVGWVKEADKDIPTVVLYAKDAAGNDSFEVSVTIDGAPLAARLEGLALSVDPGVHTFRFQWQDGSSKDRQVLVSQGQKDRVVSASLVPAGGMPAPLATTQVLPPALPPAPDRAASWRTAGWVAGGVGVVGLGLGAVFTAVTLSDKSAGQCNDLGACKSFGSVESAKGAAAVAGVGFIGGGALVVTGALLLLSTPAPREASPAPPRTRLRAVPTIGARGAGLLVGGAW